MLIMLKKIPGFFKPILYPHLFTELHYLLLLFRNLLFLDPYTVQNLQQYNSNKFLFFMIGPKYSTKSTATQWKIISLQLEKRYTTQYYNKVTIWVSN